MKRFYYLFFLLLLSGFSLKSYSQQQVSFSIQAHQDDWSLFWVRSITTDLNAGGKVVFITLTAGDGGNGANNYCSPVPYFLAREKGAMYGTKLAADYAGGLPALFPDSIRTSVNGHSIVKYTYKNTVNYFLRLCDGDIPGNGYPYTGDASLKKLKRGLIPSMTAVDGTATYNGWSDLTNTLRSIIRLEKGTDNQVIIHTSSLDTTGTNIGDHSDHIHTSLAAQEAVADLLWVGINEYVDYNSPSYPSAAANLTTTQLAVASAIFAANSFGILENKYTAPFDDGHKSWLPIDVLTIKRAPVGNAPATF